MGSTPRDGIWQEAHVDGNLIPLLYLIPEGGVDVVESFSPAPLSRLTFEDAWNAWRGKEHRLGVRLGVKSTFDLRLGVK